VGRESGNMIEAWRIPRPRANLALRIRADRQGHGKQGDPLEVTRILLAARHDTSSGGPPRRRRPGSEAERSDLERRRLNESRKSAPGGHGYAHPRRLAGQRALEGPRSPRERVEDGPVPSGRLGFERRHFEVRPGREMVAKRWNGNETGARSGSSIRVASEPPHSSRACAEPPGRPSPQRGKAGGGTVEVGWCSRSTTYIRRTRPP